jgi:hypothetical protein
MVVDVSQTILTPPESTALANAIQKLFLSLIAAKKAGATGAQLATDAVVLSVATIEPILAGLTGIPGEVLVEPVGVAEAFAIAGFGIARTLGGN